jgi:UvrD/REP helicase N-terminal domain
MQIVVPYGGARQRACPSSSPLIVFPAKGIFDDLVNDSGSPSNNDYSLSGKAQPAATSRGRARRIGFSRGRTSFDHCGCRLRQDQRAAHRVAHLIVNGADPHRVMLVTFSRRAAGEMIRRVERIVANVMRMQDDRHTGTNPRGYAREQVEAAPSSWIDPNPLRPVAPLLAALS